MKTIKFPPNKTPDDAAEVASPKDEWYRRPTVYLDIPANIVKQLKVGAGLELELKGKIIGLETREQDGGKARGEINVELSEVSFPSDNVFEKMADEEMKGED